jgi:hypothetical protein
MILVFDGLFLFTILLVLVREGTYDVKKYIRIIYSYFVLLLDNSIKLKPTAFDIKKDSGIIVMLELWQCDFYREIHCFYFCIFLPSLRNNEQKQMVIEWKNTFRRMVLTALFCFHLHTC